MKWSFRFIFILTVLLVIASFFRWSESETISTTTPGVHLTYIKDRWVGQAWVEYCPPTALCIKNYEVPLVIESDRHNSYEALIQEHGKHGLSGFLVQAWRTRDLATFIWITITSISFAGTIFTFVSFKRRKK
ncbi:hypothetical protein DS745_04110 [Anaerobacillus alkaliphilus]|uniref:Uncharacterized protein n=1 Tax=Anaerobacillus alkaliphilus TaxID=1548597 RepID=A0A4Q0VZP5_9BACI|nr:hypothetical protein [Anaerobacillus alkaliphilus]RXJ04576.1 hypothetical protein DS745_04110 [Anaerobacillus alkaliphilus]